MISNRITVVLDACVLCSPLKRGLILFLAESALFRVHWSVEIMDETEAAIVTILRKKDHETVTERALQARRIMTRAFEDATVQNYQRFGKTIGELPDEGDRHVMAAAIKSKADIIVTENLKDFPRKKLAAYGIKPQSSDDFIADAINIDTSLAIAAIKRFRLSLNRPDKTGDVFLKDMERTGLKRAASQLRVSRNLI